MQRPVLALAAFAALAITVPARATVEGYILYNVPYLSIQTDDVCFMRLPLLTSFGIPAAQVTQASLAPTAILKDFPSRQYVNVNLAAPAKAMVHTYLADAVTDAGVWEYSMKLDVTALSTSNGLSTAGRGATIKAAKLALLAIARNLDDLSGGSYRLRVTFVGLPYQTGLSGTKLYSTTAYPYSATSALLIAYERELIDREGTCPAAFE